MSLEDDYQFTRGDILSYLQPSQGCVAPVDNNPFMVLNVSDCEVFISALTLDILQDDGKRAEFWVTNSHRQHFTLISSIPSAQQKRE